MTPVRTVVICGPTACGKTHLAIETAKAFDGEIVSCDSMQLYKFMDVGSAKPTPAELAEVRHHLVGSVDPREPFSVVQYKALAMRAIEDIAGRGRLPLVCGGSGLYLNSLLYDMDFAAQPEESSLREELYALAEQKGPEALHAVLMREDPQAAARIHPHNIKRVVRAIEAERAGRPIGDISREPVRNSRLSPIIIGLKRERHELYERIDRRVDEIMAAGLEDEVKGLMAMGLGAGSISMQGIGYKEMIACLNGAISREEAAALIKKNTRHYAKRQITWFRRYADITWFDISSRGDDNKCIEEIKAWLGKRL